MGSNIGIASSNILQEKFRQAEQDRYRGNPAREEIKTLEGVIVAQKQLVTGGRFVFGVRVSFDDLPSNIRISSFDRWYGLVYPMDFLLQVFGDDLIGRRCQLKYSAAQPEYGLIYIVGEQQFSSNLDESKSLPSFSTVFAPAGKA